MKAIVIGCGRMGVRHIQALMELNISIQGIFDMNSESCKQTLEKYNLSKDIIYQNVDDLFKLKPDICVIATTAPSHKEYIMEAIESGIKKILCEKPLSVSLKDCYEIMEACEKNRVELAVNHQMRFLDQYIIPKKLAVSEEFGGLESINVTAGNFGMAMNGTHYIELMRFMFDEGANQVTAWFDGEDLPNPRGPDFRDKSGSMRITTASGKKFYLDASCNNGHGLIVSYIAKRGQILVDELAGNVYATCRKIEDKDLPSTRYGQPSVIKTEKIAPVDIVESTKAVINALIEGKGYPSVSDATLAVKTLVCAYVSNENNNKAVELSDDNLPIERVFAWA
jgi:predicted dehydrogenase